MRRQVISVSVLGILIIAMVTAIHAMSWWLSPFGSIHPERPVWGAILLFQGTCSGILLLGCLLVPKRIQGRRGGEDWFLSIHLGWLLAISVVGAGLHVFAKYHLFFPIKTDCLTEARSIWMEHDRIVDPLWMRACSMLGYILSHFAMPGLFFAAYRLCRRDLTARALAIFVGFLVVMTVFSVMILSRMVMLTSLIITFIGVALAFCNSGGADNDLRRYARGGIVLAIFLAVSVGFSALIFSTKIGCGTHTAERYVITNFEGTDVIFKNDKSYDRNKSVLGPLLPTFSYLNHAFYNFAIVMDEVERGTPVLSSFIYAYAARLGILPEPKNVRVYARGGLTLPGASYHDFGYPGIILVASLLAVFWGLGSVMLAGRPISQLCGALLLVSVGLSMAMSLLFVAPATISYPFVVFAFLCCILGQWVGEVRSSRSGIERASE